MDKIRTILMELDVFLTGAKRSNNVFISDYWSLFDTIYLSDGGYSRVTIFTDLNMHLESESLEGPRSQWGASAPIRARLVEAMRKERENWL